MSDRELSEHEIGSTEELANTVLGQAIRERASDIHIDPVENGMRIRYRIDGYLQERWTLPNYKLDLFINRLKVISNLDITSNFRKRIRIRKKSAWSPPASLSSIP